MGEHQTEDLEAAGSNPAQSTLFIQTFIYIKQIILIMQKRESKAEQEFNQKWLEENEKHVTKIPEGGKD